MPRAVHLILLASLVVTLTGCVSASSTRLGKAAIRPAVETETVVIYRTADQVPGRYDEVALLNVEGNHPVAKEERLYSKMRKEAAKLGANAVILDVVIEPEKDQRSSTKWWLEVGRAVVNVVNPPNRKGKAIAIYVYPK